MVGQERDALPPSPVFILMCGAAGVVVNLQMGGVVGAMVFAAIWLVTSAGLSLLGARRGRQAALFAASAVVVGALAVLLWLVLG